ncbi:MAG TPA: D-aminoacyl-tRNA deacylase [Elusimicrobiota bacterium]|nr:D-aminoacyl-tRNA deacylase [Elusimicrobiota bacterium]
MKALIQRVSAAGVSIENQPERPIGRGLVVFLGITASDTDKDIRWLAEKILNLRVFPKPPAEAAAAPSDSEFDLAVADIGGEILLVSQFTLYADVRRGRRPDFSRAAPPAQAQILYEKFVTRLRGLHPKLVTGEFGARMRVRIQNEGPVTLLIESPADAPAVETA